MVTSVVSDISVELPFGFIDALSRAATLAEVLDVAARWLPSVLGAQLGGVMMVEAGALRVRSFFGRSPIGADTVFDMTTSRAGRVFRERRTMVFDYDPAEMNAMSEAMHRTGFDCTIIAPLVSGDACFGTVYLIHAEFGYFKQWHVAALSAIARFMASQIRIHQQMEQLQVLAVTDPLTGALNRRAFIGRSEAYIRRLQETGRGFALVLLDLDRFKMVNDTFGHMGGDRLLCVVVSAITADIRGMDMLARLGGEEFAILLDGAGEAAAELAGERLREVIESLATPCGEGRLIRCTASVGVAVAQDADRRIEDVLRRADAALYAAKAKGRNRVEMAA